MEFGKEVFCLTSVLKRSSDRVMDSFGLSHSDARVLKFIDYREKQGLPTYQKDIEKDFHIRRSSVTSLMQSIEKSGLIERVDDPKDARLKQIVLTDLGKEKIILVKKNFEDFEEKLRSLLGEDDYVLICEKLRFVTESLLKEENDG